MGGTKHQDFAPPSKGSDPPKLKKRLYQVWRGRNVISCYPPFVFLDVNRNGFLFNLVFINLGIVLQENVECN